MYQVLCQVSAYIMSLSPHMHRRKLRHRKGNLLKIVKSQTHWTQKPLDLPTVLCCPEHVLVSIGWIRTIERFDQLPVL